MPLAAKAGRLALRSLRLLDVAGVIAQLRFEALRKTYFDRLWSSVGDRLGATCESWGDGFQRLNRGGLSVIVRGSELRLDDHLTLAIMGDKPLTLALLADQGFTAPRHARFSLLDLKPALALLEQTGRPIVVKPASGGAGGNGVTTGITSRSQLLRAAWLACRFDSDLLAETQIEGHSYRLLYLDGVLIDAIRRDPPRLTGDGRASIRSLVAAENHRRLNVRPFTALSPLRLDRDAINYLASQNLSPSSRLADGETIVVKRAVNQNSASENHVVTGQVHPATAAACGHLVSNLGVRFAGLDIIARDIAAPLSPENGMIGEINTTPGLQHHGLVAERGDSRMIAAEVVEYLFKTRTGVMIKPMPRQTVNLLRQASA